MTSLKESIRWDFIVDVRFALGVGQSQMLMMFQEVETSLQQDFMRVEIKYKIKNK